MQRMVVCRMVFVFCVSIAMMAHAEKKQKEAAKYQERHRDEALVEIEENNQKIESEILKETGKKLTEQRKREQEEKAHRFWLRVDGSDFDIPNSPNEFQKRFYFPPVRQYLTGTCWSFSTTSFFESEVARISGKKIKLSEMYTAYYEYLEKARRYIEERGDSFIGETSEGNAIMRIWSKYGVVTSDAYKGVLSSDGRYDHSIMVPKIHDYLEMVKQTGDWDQKRVLAAVRLIMDGFMGRPPERFVYQGKWYTPSRFVKEVLQLALDDYVCLMSTLSKPFYAFGEYQVEGNWWHSKDYYNVPLDQFYQIIKHAVQNGYTVKINGDVSEPGHDGLRDVAYIPTFDIPYKYINQSARELRFFNRSTDDDHDTHLVGWLRMKDFDWFLVKDSSSSAFHGKHKGYYFYREDFIKLKTLTYIVHKDAVKAVVKNFKPLR